jgi:hypothetical protein
MAIHRLLQNSAFAPEDIGRLVVAYEDALRVVGSIVAKKIMDIAKTGERDPERMRRFALKGIGIPLDD